jgi:hypothetical protein
MTETVRRETGPTHVAIRPLGYLGAPIDRGQVVRLAGAAHDAALVRLRFVAPVDPGASLHECATCGAQFAAPGMRDGHARARHGGSVGDQVEAR